MKDLFNNIALVDEADDPHLSFTLGTGKRIALIDLSDEVGPALNAVARVWKKKLAAKQNDCYILVARRTEKEGLRCIKGCRMTKLRKR